MSSDKISGIRKPLLMLKLEVMQPDGSTKEQLVELDNAELGSLLKTLKQAQKVMSAVILIACIFNLYYSDLFTFLFFLISFISANALLSLRVCWKSMFINRKCKQNSKQIF